jgi:hypothetical protein
MTSHSSNDIETRVDNLLQVAHGLPADAIKVPDMPMPTFFDEGFGYVASAREHKKELLAVGMPEALIDQLETCLQATQAQQTAWNTEQNKGRSEELKKQIAEAESLRGDSLAACDLALRNNADGQRRLAAIREGEGLPDLVADHHDMERLIMDNAPLFAAVKLEPEKMAAQHRDTAARLQQGLSQEEAQKSVSTAKELRDRLYTLTLEPIREIRAFADFAFRKDRGNNRRFAFTSAYIRRRNRRSARNVAAAALTAAATTVTEG